MLFGTLVAQSIMEQDTILIGAVVIAVLVLDVFLILLDCPILSKQVFRGNLVAVYVLIPGYGLILGAFLSSQTSAVS